MPSSTPSRRSTSQGRAAPGLPQFVPVYNLAARLFIDADRMEDAASALQAGRRLTEEYGFAWGQAECHALLAERLFHIGEWDDSVAEAETAVELCEMFGAWHAYGTAKSILALVALRRNEIQRASGDVAAARDKLDFGTRSVRTTMGLVGDRPRPRGGGRPQWSAPKLRGGMGRLGGHRLGRGDHRARSRAPGHHPRRQTRWASRRRDANLTARSASAGLPRIGAAAMLCRGLVDGDVDALEASVGAYRAITRPYELARACEATGLTLGRVARGRRPSPMFGRASRSMSSSARPGTLPAWMRPCERSAFVADDAAPGDVPATGWRV